MPRTAMDDDLLEAARAVMRISLHAADQIGGVSVVQLRALTVLDREGTANLAQLAEGMGVTVSTTSRLVDRLVAAGLVDRRTATHTRREIALRLTAAAGRRSPATTTCGSAACTPALTARRRHPGEALAGLRAFGDAAAAP